METRPLTFPTHLKRYPFFPRRTFHLYKNPFYQKKKKRTKRALQESWALEMKPHTLDTFDPHPIPSSQFLSQPNVLTSFIYSFSSLNFFQTTTTIDFEAPHSFLSTLLCRNPLPFFYLTHPPI